MNFSLKPLSLGLAVITGLFAVATTTRGDSATPVPAGIVAWWQAESNAVDSIGGNHGTPMGSLSYTNGMVGQAFLLTTTNQGVRIPASSSLNVGVNAGFTIEGWINPRDVTEFRPIIEWNDATSWGVHFSICPGQPFNVSPGPGELYANIVDSSGFWHQLSSPGGVVTSNVFQHVALTYDKTTGVAMIYCNGQIVGQQSLGSFTPKTTQEVYLGQRHPSLPDQATFSGALDELSLYNRALSTNEIAAIYHAGSAGKSASTLPKVPAIFSFTPAVATTGTVVAISGTNFSTTAEANIVYFGAVRAAVTFATPTNLLVAVPTGATYAPITVTVGGLQAASSHSFEPTFMGDGSAISNSSFAPSFNLAGGSGPTDTVIADLDGDGRPDLACVNYNAHTVSLFRNISTSSVLSPASFAARVDLVLSVGTNSGGVFKLQAGDVDGDGRLDLLACEVGGSRVSIFHNIATSGSLTTNSFASPVSFNTSSDCRFATVTDMDADGRPDLIAVNYGANTISILKNIGLGGGVTSNLFALPVNFACAGGPLYEVGVGDLDGDGKPDLAIPDIGGYISVFRNTSTQGIIDTNTLAPRFDLPAQYFTMSVVTGDLDGDGKAELIACAYLSENLSVYRNLSLPGTLTTNSFSAATVYALAGRAHELALADFNGDGKPDVAADTEMADSLAVFQNIGTSSFTNTSLANRVDFPAGQNACGVSAGDLNGDGRPDVVFANQYSDTVTIYQNQTPLSTNRPPAIAPFIVQQPTNQTVVAGSTATLSVTAEGTAPLYYQWSFNGTNLAGANQMSLSLSNVQPAQAGSYAVAVINFVGSVTSSNAALSVIVTPTPPTISTQPIGRSVPPGLPTTLTAVASATPAPSYQWQLNGTNIPGATGPSYTIPSVGTDHLGNYHLVASNSVGVTTSANAQLTFGVVAAWGRNFKNECLPPPGLTDVSAIVGTYQASFAVRTDGTIAAWGSGSATNIPANASNVVALASSGLAHYALRSDGGVVGWPAAIDVSTLTNVVALAVGENIVGSFGYALRAEGTLTNWGSSLTPGFPAGLNNLKAIAAGYNYAVALKQNGTIVVAGSGITANIPAGLSNVVAVAVGYNFALALKADGRVVAWGSGNITNLPAGLTNVVAVSASIMPNEYYGLAVRADGKVVTWGDNSYGQSTPPTAMSNLATIAGQAAFNHGLALVNDGRPVILQPPVGLTAFTGRDVTLRGTAAGVAPLNYQWLLNGTNVPGATNSTLNLANLQADHAGNYQLQVTNSLGSALSLVAPLQVLSNNALTFLSQTMGSATNVYQGGKVIFSGGLVLGSGPLRYQWFYSPTNQNYLVVPSATNDTLLLDPALAGQSGNYYLAVSNLVSGITSAPVSIKIQFARAWGYQAANPPVNVTNAVAIATGTGNSSSSSDYFALGADGKLTVWANYFPNYGETNVSALSNAFVTAIAAGPQHTLALKSDGTVYAWGYGYYGQTNPPAGLNSIVAIACGNFHDLALKADGTIVGWGAAVPYNYGQATSNPAATNVMAIAAGDRHSLALRDDGTVVGWGYNGQSATNIPPNATNIIAIAAGSGFSAALRANGTVVQWGTGMTSYPVPANLSNVVALSGSSTHCTALRNDGTVVSWGYEYISLASNNVPTDLANVIAIASGGDHNVALFGTRAPAFTVQPWNRALLLSSHNPTNLFLIGRCAGVQPVSYQWRRNGANIVGATNDTLTMSYNGQLNTEIIPGEYQLVASNAYGVAVSKPAKLSVVYPLADALDTVSAQGTSFYNWITTGSAPWFGQTNISHDGVDAVRSGAIGVSQETVVQTTVATNWAGSYMFWWKVSSEQSFDTLEFRVNGLPLASISGEVDWQQVSIPVAAGTNVLQWRYSKDSSYDYGQDAGWVDQFVFLPNAPVITDLSASQVVNQGTNLTLSVTATGAPPLYYQWRQNGLVVGNTATLALNQVGRAHNGIYFVTVTNDGGSTASSNLTVKVTVPQVLSSLRMLPNGTLQLISGDAGGGAITPADLANFEVQFTTNLVNWMTLPNSLSLTNGTLLLQDNGRTNSPARFYRILEH